MRRLGFALLCCLGLSAADPKPAVDAETAAKAKAALDAYGRERDANAPRPDPEVEALLADFEERLLEAETFAKAMDGAKAGERYLAAHAVRRKIPKEQRPLLGLRWSQAEERFQALTRLFGQLEPASSATTPAPAPATATGPF